MSHTGQVAGVRLGAGALPAPEEQASLSLYKVMLAAVPNTPWNTQGLKHKESATLTPGGSLADTPTGKQLTLCCVLQPAETSPGGTHRGEQVGVQASGSFYFGNSQDKEKTIL